MVGSWLPTQVSQSIEYKESFVVAAYISGPKWSSKKSTSYRRVAQWQKSCSQALQEPLPSCHWFAISVSWRACYSFPFTVFPVREKSNPISDSPLPSQFQHFHWLAPHADTKQTTVPRSLCIGPSLTDTCPFYLTHCLSPSTRKLYASP